MNEITLEYCFFFIFAGSVLAASRVHFFWALKIWDIFLVTNVGYMCAAQSNVSKFTAQSVQKMQEGHISASVTTSKGYFLFLSFVVICFLCPVPNLYFGAIIFFPAPCVFIILRRIQYSLLSFFVCLQQQGHSSLFQHLRAANRMRRSFD